MGLDTGQTIIQGDFIQVADKDATPANDANKAPKMEADGKLSPFFTKAATIPNAGATINGETLPVPVYQNKTDNEMYACDGNDTAALKYVGFAISNSTNANPITVQYTGVVGGFSALDEGEKYYLSDTVGTISTTPGTYEVLVGVAISTTELLIMKGKRRASGNGGSLGTANGSAVVTCGFRPSVVRVFAKGAGSAYMAAMDMTYVNGTITAVAHQYNEGTGSIVNNNARLYGDSTSYQDFTITSVGDNGFTVTWTEGGTYPGSGDGYFYWEAEGEQ